jgi:hypothetical protein
MDILNIDALASPKRQVNIFGAKHDVLELSVQDFIDNLTAANKLEAAKLSGPDEVIEGMRLSMDMIKRSVPSLSEAEVRRLNPVQIGVLLQFIRGELDNGPKKAETGAGESESDAEKKPS